ncbi:MAG: hydroxyethylthiazole kinase [Candidatus Methanomethylophilaceae archaeon]|nr:hydroxyethylthiazole kinase [Candidatus Methanomethylophilaceae archaeon]
MVADITDIFAEVQKKKPLVHQMTNYVTVNDCANITICAGGSPVMSDAKEDVEDMVSIASALVLNIGTLNSRTNESMILAGKTANELNIPVILDPVGVGATRFRTKTAEDILDSVRISVIKGNAGEIGILAGSGGVVKGVDSISGSDNAEETVKALSRATDAIIGMTGKTDYVSDGKAVYVLNNGDNYLETVSGTGCMVSSVVGCYVGAHGVSVDSIAAAISIFNIAGEIAAMTAKGPGSFKTKLFDSMYNITAADINDRLKIRT